MTAALLFLALAAYIYFFRGDFGGLRALAGVPGSEARRRRYRVRMVKALALFGGTTIVVLAALGRVDALVVMPPEFAPLAAAIDIDPTRLPWLLGPGIALGSATGMAWSWWRGRRGRGPAMLGDHSAVLAQGRGEAGLALLSALVAGVTEELYFRLLTPLLVALITGSALVGFVVATALFALAHRYQRWPGVVATGLAGAMLTAIYLASGALWLAIAVHVAIDVNGLVLRPWAAGMLRAD